MSNARMNRRARVQSKTDDLAYPVRVKVRVPGMGLGTLNTRLAIWLNEELGKDRHATHSAQTLTGQGITIYFRTLEDTKRFVAAFPELEIANSVGMSV